MAPAAGAGKTREFFPGAGPSFRLRAIGAAALGVFCCLAAAAPDALALSREDRNFLDYLIKEVKYYDTAVRFISAVEKNYRADQDSLAELESGRIDALKGQGKEAEALKAIEEFKRKFPRHARSSLGNLEAIGVNLRKAIELLDKAALEPDKVKAGGYAKDAAKMFDTEITGPLDGLIIDLQQRSAEAKKREAAQQPGGAARGAPKPTAGPRKEHSDEYNTLFKSLAYTELVRLQFLLAYARKLDENLPERKTILEKGLKYSEEFVRKRFEFPIMYFEAQLHTGLYAAELGRNDAAEENLNPLYDLEPPFERPYTRETIDAFKTLRLRAVLYSARAMNSARKFPAAASILERHIFAPKKDEFDLSKAEDDPSLKSLAVLARLEHGISLAGSGQGQKGFEEIQAVIRKPGQPPPMVIDARKALGRLALIGGVSLRPRDYYQAALGLKSEIKIEGAIDMFQRALTSLTPADRREMNDLGPLCLNEIGELQFITGRFIEAALAYQEVFRQFPSAPGDLLGKVSTNFLASVTRAMKATEGGLTHSGLLKLKEEATRLSESYAGGFTVLESLLFDGRNLESQGKYEAARQKYLEITPELKGKKVPFYWRAQASAWTCAFRQWEQADASQKKNFEADMDKAAVQLKEIAAKAAAAKESGAASIAALTLGQIHFQRNEWGPAADTLKVFVRELTDDPNSRCPALGILIIAEVNQHKLDAASEHYTLLTKDCALAPIVSLAASSLADGNDIAGNAKEAARYATLYAKHPESAEDMKRPEELMRVAGMLIDGGMIKEGELYIEKLRQLGKTGNVDLARQSVVLEAKIFQHSKEWDKVIAKLEGYVEKYKPQEDNHYEDAYVLQSLGEAYLAHTKPTSLEDMKKAHEYYNVACFVMRQRIPRNAALAETFWQWVSNFLTIKLKIGDAGEVNAYRSILDFLETVKADDKGSAKDRLLKIEKDASAKMNKPAGGAGDEKSK